MTLDEARLIKESLEELTPDIERFSWGPTYSFAQERQKVALQAIRREIKRLSQPNQ